MALRLRAGTSGELLTMRRFMSFGAAIFFLATAALAAASGPVGDPFDRSILRPQTLATSFAAGDTSISITVDKSAFPLIRVYADVTDENDFPIGGLIAEDFTVAQDGFPVDFELRRAQDFGCPTSICLVIDVSLSMEGEPIAAARDAAHAFVDRMGPYDRAAIVSFADCVQINAPFTDNRQILHQAIDQLQPIGLTASFDGIYQGILLTAGQPGDRAVIAFSDGCDNNSGSCDLPPDGWNDGYDDDSVLICDLANGAAVSLYTLTFGPLESTCLDPMDAFANGTGGSYRHSPDAAVIDSVYAEIQEAVCSRYLIAFTSPDTVANFDEHEVTVCLTNTGDPACDTMSYREPSAPIITLTEATIALGERCQTPRSDLTIEAIVIDDAPPTVQSVQLLYRAAAGDETSYTTLAMTPAGADRFSAVIPGSQWTISTPGVEYFISASDGDATVTLPASVPYQSPFVVSFCPNRPPDITNVSIICGEDNSAILSATVSDTLYYVDRAVAYYRRVGTAFYDSTTMLLQAANRYGATLSPIIPNTNYELLIRAKDDLGLVAIAGPWPFRCDTIPNDNPHPTDRWITLTCDDPIFGNDTLASGDIIRAYDPDGVLCGKAVAGFDGAFGSMLVYGDNPGTPLIDEGPLPGELITFTVNDFEVLYSPGLHWTVANDTIAVCDLLPCQVFSLEAGWHLISWNRAYTADIESFVALLGGNACVDVVLSFDNGAVAYDPDLPQYSTLHEVDYHHAYWVRLDCPADFLLCAALVVDLETIPIRPGWNLVPYWPTSTLPTEEAWEIILELVTLGLGFDNGGQVWSPDDPLHNTLTHLSPGLGYWIRSTGSGYLQYPGFIYPDFAARVPLGSFAASAVEPTSRWISVYGSDLTLDDDPVADGAAIEFIAPSGAICGQGVYRNGRLLFTPVYGADGAGSSESYAVGNDRVSIRVDGRPVYPSISWTEHGDRVVLSALSTTETERPPVLPGTLFLAQNYPNPFNPTTTITFDLPKDGWVTLTVYNILGQDIATLADGAFTQGRHSVVWNGRDRDGREAGAGLYLYRLQSDAGTHSRKMLLVK